MFTDSTAGVSAGDYQATIYWGDGNQSSGVVSNSSGTYSVSVVPLRCRREPNPKANPHGIGR